MAMAVTILPGIRKIWLLNGNALPRRVDLMGRGGIPVAILTDKEEVPFVGEPVCKRTTQEGGADEKSEATLTFSSPRRLRRLKNPAFALEDNAGRCWVLGSVEPPRLRISESEGTGTVGGDAAAVEYEVKHTGIFTMVPAMI